MKPRKLPPTHEMTAPFQENFTFPPTDKVGAFVTSLETLTKAIVTDVKLSSQTLYLKYRKPMFKRVRRSRRKHVLA